MGARPELARTHMDIGVRIGDDQLAGADGAAHLTTARSMFAELGLEWDLAQMPANDARQHDDEPGSAVA
jgi:hypothetical protein